MTGSPVAAVWYNNQISQQWPITFDAWRLAYADWLRSPPSQDRDRSLVQLRRWLQGVDLPMDVRDQDHHVWLIRGLPRDESAMAARSELARLAADTLEQVSRDHPNDAAGNGILYHFFGLCEGLSDPDRLSHALWSFLRRSPPGERSFRGFRIDDALRMAILWNQRGTEWFEELWRPLIQRRSAPLSGSALDGLDGTLHMGFGTKLEKIGYLTMAVAELVRQMEDRQDRAASFKRLIDRVKAQLHLSLHDVLLIVKPLPDWALLEIEQVGLCIGTLTALYEGFPRKKLEALVLAETKEVGNAEWIEVYGAAQTTAESALRRRPSRPADIQESIRRCDDRKLACLSFR